MVCINNRNNISVRESDYDGNEEQIDDAEGFDCGAGTVCDS